MACDESRRISTEIENLKSQLEKKVKELGYCEEKKKLRVELALKPKEMERLRKQNDELQAKNKGLQNNVSFLYDFHKFVCCTFYCENCLLLRCAQIFENCIFVSCYQWKVAYFY
jgi:regulator of replication initiation timing